MSICYSDPAQRVDLKAKLDAIYDLGARSFYIALDVISYEKWNCELDEETYGAPGRENAANAQVDLLNDIQRNWIAERAGARPLQMVPTEYGDVTPTSYKDIFKAELDPAIVVQWTGTDVIPIAVSNADAQAVSELYGRQVFLWDNYPVNDFWATSGRLLLGPYVSRDNGLSDYLTGIVSNPMNQPYASEIAVASIADFAWNDAAFEAEASWLRSLAFLADEDPELTAALAVFADLNRIAPTFGAPAQPQARPWLRSPKSSGQRGIPAPASRHSRTCRCTPTRSRRRQSSSASARTRASSLIPATGSTAPTYGAMPSRESLVHLRRGWPGTRRRRTGSPPRPRPMWQRPARCGSTRCITVGRATRACRWATGSSTS